MKFQGVVASILLAVVSRGCSMLDGPTGPEVPQTGNLSGTVLADSATVPGAMVTVTGPQQAVVPAGDGAFFLPDLVPGTYVARLRFDRSRFVFADTVKTVEVPVGGTGTVHFRGQRLPPPHGTILGSVLVEGQPVSGATVSVSGPENRSVQTGTDGNFAISGLTTGPYSVRLRYDRALYIFPDSARNILLEAGEAERVDFRGSRVVHPAPVCTINVSPSGSVEQGQSVAISWNVSGVVDSVRASGAWSGRKASSGSETFTLVVGTHTYTITCWGPGGSDRKSVTVVVSAPVPDSTIIAGRVYLDRNNSGVFEAGIDSVFAGVLVALSGTRTGSTTTNAEGRYRFADLVGGEYTVRVINPNASRFRFDNDGAHVLILQTGKVITVDFRALRVSVPHPAPTCPIFASHQAVQRGQSVAISWSPTNTTTVTASGAWSGSKNPVGGSETITLNTLGNHTFTVTCVGPGGTSSPQSVTVVATEVPAERAAITGRVWLDRNENGVFEVAADSVFTGAAIGLSGTAGGSTVTGSDGIYRFGDLSAGSYTVFLAANPDPNRYRFDQVARTVSLASGQTSTVDFRAVRATQQPSPTGNIVGTVSAGGASVAASVSVSGPENRSTQTDSNGSFSFTGLATGTYTVRLVNWDRNRFAFGDTVRTVTLEANETEAVHFAGAVVQTASCTTLEGMVFLDVNGNGTFTPSVDSVFVGHTVSISGARTASTSTDANGWYRFTGLCPGEYQVRVSNPDPNRYQFRRTNFHLEVFNTHPRVVTEHFVVLRR